MSGPAQASARQFRDCNAMHAVYRNGVAKTSSAAAHPWPFWVRIKSPVVDAGAYTVNKKLDRDNDNVACEVAR